MVEDAFEALPRLRVLGLDHLQAEPLPVLVAREEHDPLAAEGPQVGEEVVLVLGVGRLGHDGAGDGEAVLLAEARPIPPREPAQEVGDREAANRRVHPAAVTLGLVQEPGAVAGLHREEPLVALRFEAPRVVLPAQVLRVPHLQRGPPPAGVRRPLDARRGHALQDAPAEHLAHGRRGADRRPAGRELGGHGLRAALVTCGRRVEPERQPRHRVDARAEVALDAVVAAARVRQQRRAAEVAVDVEPERAAHLPHRPLRGGEVGGRAPPHDAGPAGDVGVGGHYQRSCRAARRREGGGGASSEASGDAGRRPLRASR